MPFNGSGTFNRIYSWVTDAANGIFVSSTRTDTDTNDIAAGLSNCITKDGQTTVTANIPMSGFKITGLGLGASATDAARVDNANVLNMCEGRLTLTTGTPVTTADVTGSGTIYFTPYKGNRIALYDGTNWHMYTFTELSKSNAGVGGALPTDVFVYDNSGTLTLEFSQWTNDTTRATALTTQDGVLVKTGALTRRYLGTFRSTAGGAFSDSYATRWVWNYYNRVVRPMRVLEATDSWTYTTATWRQANASTANQLDFVVGVAEDAVVAKVQAAAANTNVGVQMLAGIGLNGTGSITTGCINSSTNSQVANLPVAAVAEYIAIPAVGRTFLPWMEFSNATGTTTWSGDAGTPANTQSGIHGWIRG